MLTGLPTATQVPLALHRKLEDLMGELAYIDHFPERWGDQQEARVLRRVAVLHMIAEIRSQLVNGAWAMPVELSEPPSPHSGAGCEHCGGCRHCGAHCIERCICIQESVA